MPLNPPILWLCSATGFIWADVMLFDSRSMNQSRHFPKMVYENFVMLPAGCATFQECCRIHVPE